MGWMIWWGWAVTIRLLQTCRFDSSEHSDSIPLSIFPFDSSELRVLYYDWIRESIIPIRFLRAFRLDSSECIAIPFLRVYSDWVPAIIPIGFIPATIPIPPSISMIPEKKDSSVPPSIFSIRFMRSLRLRSSKRSNSSEHSESIPSSVPNRFLRAFRLGSSKASVAPNIPSQGLGELFEGKSCCGQWHGAWGRARTVSFL